MSEKEVLTIHQNILKEQVETEIRFDNEKDFIEFSKFMALFAGIPSSIILEQVKHEVEPSKTYKEVGIKSHFGWHNFSIQTKIPFLRGKKFQAFHQPFGNKYKALLPFEKDKLQYKSLKIVSTPSEGDKEAIIRIEKRWGNKIKD